jgi:hypothetical protein
VIRRRLGALPLIVLLVAISACGAKRFAPPSGPGAPFPDHAAAFDDATAECRGAKTISATLALSGRAGTTRLRGRVDAGFAAPREVRLEGRAPFGRPVFILVSRDDSTATLLLPRDNRVLRDAPAASIVEALAGVALTADELRSAVAGCGFGASNPSAGRSYGGVVAIDTSDGISYLRRVDDRWRLVASVRGTLTIEYRDFSSRRPSTIRMRTTASPTAAGPQADLTMKLSDVNINIPLGPEVFSVEIPVGADPLTLEELRRAGPLGDARDSGLGTRDSGLGTRIN